ncbi:MAG TPA: hydroxyisourate hydrolase [Actinomycetes bacterium]|jgi:5-hydroxyisourate hydrolase|nr:hydroxyisourate hydrolase [Actinomycetes bacterium]
MSGLTTHVLDTARGRPAAGVRVTVQVQDGDGWRDVGGGVTDTDGRVPGLLAGELSAGTHRLTFATGAWFEAQGVAGFYPEVAVVCRIDDPAAHYHVPLLLSPYGYSTYRGS